MITEHRYFGCYACAGEEGTGCIIFQNGIVSKPIICPCGFRDAQFILITEKIEKAFGEIK